MDEKKPGSWFYAVTIVLCMCSAAWVIAGEGPTRILGAVVCGVLFRYMLYTNDLSDALHSAEVRLDSAREGRVIFGNCAALAPEASKQLTERYSGRVMQPRSDFPGGLVEQGERAGIFVRRCYTSALYFEATIHEGDKVLREVQVYKGLCDGKYRPLAQNNFCALTPDELAQVEQALQNALES